MKHHYHSFAKRGVVSFLLVLAVMLIGTVGMHRLEGFNFIDSFYFTSMIATGQGPVSQFSPVTNAGKIFTAFLAFLSAGVMITAFGFLFGPFLGKLWKVGVEKFEEEVKLLHSKKNKMGNSADL